MCFSTICLFPAGIFLQKDERAGQPGKLRPGTRLAIEGAGPALPPPPPPPGCDAPLWLGEEVAGMLI